MTVLASISLFAASLASSPIGEFFELPEWMPDGVSSQDTPGSDPEDMGGWYIGGFRTNAVPGKTSSFTIYMSPAGSNDWVNVTARCTRQGFNHETGVWEFKFSDLPRVAYSDYSHEYARTLRFRYAMDTRDVEFLCKGHSTQIVQKISHATRTPRMTPEAIASFYATMEAYCERQYCTIQGETNSWDEATYGPADDRQRFWFDPFGNSPNGSEWSYGTNRQERIVESRRLYDYDSMAELLDFIHNRLVSPSGVPMRFCDRPGWINDRDDRTWIGWWSTSSQDVFDSEDIVPTISNWVEDPTTPYSNEWNRCCLCFSNLKYCDTWKIYNHPNVDTPPVKPWRQAMQALDFDQPRNYDYTVAGKYVSDMTMTNALMAAYPHADGEAIARGTRRLRTEAVACANQFLGLMDRTYLNPETIYGCSGTNYTYHNECSCKGSVEGLSATFDQMTQSWKLTPLPTNICWGSYTFTNRQWATQMATDGLQMYSTVTETSTGATLTFSLNPPITIPEDTDFVETIVRHFVGDVDLAEDKDFQIFVDLSTAAVAPNGMLYAVCEFVYDNNFMADDVPFLNPEAYLTEDIYMDVVFGYDRSYSYMKCLDARVGLIQGEGDTGDRVYDRKYGAVIGYHGKRNDVLIPATHKFIWTSGAFARYRTHSGDFSSRADLNSIIRSEIIEGLEDKFEAEYGKNPRAWRTIIPVREDLADKARDKPRITECSIVFSGVYSGYDIRGKVNAGGVTISSFFTRRHDGVSYEGFLPGISATVHVVSDPDTSDTDESDGLQIQSRIEVMTKTDWEWKTLKRTDD